MKRLLARVAVCGGVTALALAPLVSASPPAEGEITFDVVVTDRSARFVSDLTPGEVEVTVAGERRTVDAVRRPADAARVIGIVLDDFHVRSGESTARARTALLRMVDDHLRDGDSVAVVKPLDPLHAISFVSDRDAVRRAIATFEGRAGDYTPRTDFERNFLSRDPKTADATRAQVVSAALQVLARRLGEHRAGRKALILVTEGFRPAQPRAIVHAANRNGVAIHPIDPHPEPSDHDSLIRALADETGGTAGINEPALDRACAQAIADLDHYVIVSFAASGPEDGRFRRVDVRVTRPGLLARARAGYWAPDAALAAAAARAAAPRPALPLRPAYSSPYIRPWIGMSRASGGATRVTVTWEGAAPPPRNQRIASVRVKAVDGQGTVLLEQVVGAGEAGRAAFDAPPGVIALELGLATTTGVPLDADYRMVSVPDLQVAKPTLATPQILRTRTARQFAEVSRDPDAPPSPSRTFSRTERLLVRVPAYGAGDAPLAVTARLLNGRGEAMRELPAVAAPLAPGVVQFDLPLSALAPGDYRLELAAANAAGPPDEAKEILVFRITN